MTKEVEEALEWAEQVDRMPEAISILARALRESEARVKELEASLEREVNSCKVFPADKMALALVTMERDSARRELADMVERKELGYREAMANLRRAEKAEAQVEKMRAVVEAARKLSDLCASLCATRQWRWGFDDIHSFLLGLSRALAALDGKEAK